MTRVFLGLVTFGAFGLVACNGEGATNPAGDDPVPTVGGDDDDDSDDDTASAGTDDNDSIATAESTDHASLVPDTLVELTNGRMALNPAGDRDFYEVKVDAGEMYMFYTDATHYNGGDTIVDTVLRVWDEDENPLAENDDMPYRWWETDSAVWLEAPYSGSIYVEVLEWSDWAGGYEDDNGDWVPVPAKGGADFKYQLYGARRSVTEAEPNDTQAEADALASNGLWQTVWSEYASEFVGTFDGGGVDLWPLDMTGDQVGLYMEWSLYPGTTPSGAEPKFVLYNQNFEVVARTSDPEIEPGSAIVDYVGLAYRIEAEGKYYLGISESTGSTADYVGIIGTVRWLNDLTEGTKANDKINDAEDIPMMESAGTPGFWFANMFGDQATGDDVDVFRITDDDVSLLADDLTGKHLTVRIQSETAGSTLTTDLKITDKDGNELAASTDHPTNGSGDPEIRDLQLSNSDDIYVHVTADDRGTDEGANWWMMSIYLSDTKVYSP
jgi:hypothetical protein